MYPCISPCYRPHPSCRYYLAASTGRVHMWTKAHVCEGCVEVGLSLLCAMGGALGLKRAPAYRLFPGMYVWATMALRIRLWRSVFVYPHARESR